MANLSPFCTCTDLRCPNHPVNHDKGCSLCIQKNRALGEIPSCFFNRADPNYAGPAYFMEDFARLMEKRTACVSRPETK